MKPGSTLCMIDGIQDGTGTSSFDTAQVLLNPALVSADIRLPQ